METYRLNSRLVERDREYTIQTTNDIGTGSISSEVFVNGALADATMLPHPEQWVYNELSWRLCDLRRG